MSSSPPSTVLKAFIVAFFMAFALLALALGVAWSIDGLMSLPDWVMWVTTGVLALPIAWATGAIFVRVLQYERARDTKPPSADRGAAR
jgi:hypothetical protein